MTDEKCRVCRCRLRDSVGRPITTRNCHGCGRTREATLAWLADHALRDVEAGRHVGAGEEQEADIRKQIERVGAIRGVEESGNG